MGTITLDKKKTRSLGFERNKKTRKKKRILSNLQDAEGAGDGKRVQDP